MKNILKMFAGVVSVLTVFFGMDINAMQQRPTAFGHTVFSPQQIDLVEQIIAGDLNQDEMPDNFAWQLNGVENIANGVYLLAASFTDNHYYYNFPTSLLVAEEMDEDDGMYYYFVFVANEDNMLDGNSWGFQAVLNELARFLNGNAVKNISNDKSSGGDNSDHDKDHSSDEDGFDDYDASVLYKSGCFNCILAD